MSDGTIDETEDILVRLRRIEGQVRGLQHMIEQHRDCEDVVTQVMAVRAALDQVGLIAMQRYVNNCVPGASDEARDNLKRALELLLKLSH